MQADHAVVSPHRWLIMHISVTNYIRAVIETIYTLKLLKNNISYGPLHTLRMRHPPR